MFDYKNMDVEALIKKLRSWDKKYFETGTSPVSDAKYDKVKSYVQKKYSKHEYFKQVGFEPASDKVRLPIPMFSLDKKRPGEAAEWAASHKKPNFVLLPKFDGTAGLLHYRKGRLIGVFTRGDGTIGRNVTEKAKYIQGVWPKLQAPDVHQDKIKKDVYIRGEFIMHKYLFSKLAENTEYKNARNLCTGMLNKKDLTSEDIAILRKMTFVTFNCEYGDPEPIMNQILMLGSMQFITATWPGRLSNTGIKNVDNIYRVPRAVNQHIPNHCHFSTYPTEMFMANAIGDWERIAQIDLDGIVIVHNVPKGEQFAVKLDPENQASQIGIVGSIEWNKSSRGVLKPVVILKKPLLFNGVAVNRVTGVNAKFIIENGIYPNAKVKIIRSGEVIPRLVSVKHDGKWYKARSGADG